MKDMGRRRNRRFLRLLPFGPEVVYYNDHESAAQVLHGWYRRWSASCNAGPPEMPCMPAAMHTPDSQCSSANTAAAASRKKARTAGDIPVTALPGRMLAISRNLQPNCCTLHWCRTIAARSHARGRTGCSPMTARPRCL